MSARQNVDAIADAIAPKELVARRTVAGGAMWSIPIISSAIAAPVMAASVPLCSECVGNTGAPNCILSAGGDGNCACASGLVCVGTGPLGLVNICVGTSLLAASCGGTTCYGICLSGGGLIPPLINSLAAAITTFVNVIGTIAGSVTGTTPCTSSVPLPNNWCVSPLTDGGLGTLCTSMKSCNTGTGLLGGAASLTIGTALATLSATYNTLITALGTLGLVANTSCDSPYVCTPFLEVAAGQTFDMGLGGEAKYGVDMYVGFCQCPSGKDFCYDNAINFPCTLS